MRKGKTRLEMWQTSRWIYIKYVTKSVFSAADTSTIRLILAWASLLYGLVLLWSLFIGHPTFQRPFFALMAWYGPEWAWAALFFIHWFGVHWRLFDVYSRPAWALAVNGLGFMLWFISTLSVNLAAQILTPSTVLEWTMCAASAWALYQTGLKKEAVTP